MKLYQKFHRLQLTNTLIKYNESTNRSKINSLKKNSQKNEDTIYQPLRSGRIWHKVNF